MTEGAVWQGLPSMDSLLLDDGFVLDEALATTLDDLSQVRSRGKSLWEIC